MGNLHLVTGYSGQPHVRAADHASLFEAAVRGGQFVLEAGKKFSASVINNNLIRIYDGEGVNQGRHFKIDPGSYVDVQIENGAQGVSRIDLVVARYSRDAETGIEEKNLIAIKGVPAANNPEVPSYTVGNINSGNALVSDMPMYRIPIDGLNIGVPMPLFEVKPPVGSALFATDTTLSVPGRAADAGAVGTALAGKAPAGYGLGTTDPAVVTDLNTQIAGGVFAFGSDCANAPFQYGTLLVIPRRWDETQQIAFDLSNNKISVRNCTSNTWDEWVDWSPSAFAPNGYGLGGACVPVTSWDLATKNGFYVCEGWYGCVSNYYDRDVVQECFGQMSGIMYKRFRWFCDGAWSEWEWVNPPMTPGTEYRTTERYDGKPVYAKAVNFGALPNNGSTAIPHGVSNIKLPIRKNLVTGSTFMMLENVPNITNVSITDESFSTPSSIVINTNTNMSHISVVVEMWYTK